MTPVRHLPSEHRRADGSAWGASVAVLGLLQLLGCAAPPGPADQAAPVTPAPAPAAGPSARLLARGAVPAQDRFAVFRLADSALCKGPSLLIDSTADKSPRPALLAAGTLTTLDFVILRDGKASCAARWSFTPVAGKTYLLQGLALGSGCVARLYDASAPDRPVPASDAVLRSARGQACLPLDQARAASGSDALIRGGQQQGEAVLDPQATTRDLQELIRP